MAERSFTWFPKLTRVVNDVPDDASRSELVMAIANYGTFGEEPDLKWPLSSIFEAVRDDINNSVNARSGNRGGRPRKNQVSESGNGGSVKNDRVSENKNGGFEKEKPVSENKNGGFGENENQETPLIYTKPSQDIPRQAKPEDCPFPLACLVVLNDELGTAYGGLPPKVALHLNAMEGRYQVDDVRAMVAYKRDEWRGTRFARNLTPNTLLGPDHFEQYIHQSRQAKEDEHEFAEYD